MKTEIRRAIASDVPALMKLVKELAVFEKAADQVENTEAQMLEEGFGETPAFGAFVAEVNSEIEGIAIFYYRYSTWKGKRLYLEDIVVSEQSRGKGLGKALLERTITEAKETKCSGMMWQVLDWNQPAIEFYKKYGTRFDKGWLNCHLDF